MKIRKPIELAKRVGVRGGHTTTVEDILPFLPKEDYFVYETTDRFLPFALTTRVACNNQQYLLLYEDNLQGERD